MPPPNAHSLFQWFTRDPRIETWNEKNLYILITLEKPAGVNASKCKKWGPEWWSAFFWGHRCRSLEGNIEICARFVIWKCKGRKHSTMAMAHICSNTVLVSWGRVSQGLAYNLLWSRSWHCGAMELKRTKTLWKYKLPIYKFIPWNNISMWQWFNVWVVCWNPLYTVWLWQKRKKNSIQPVQVKFYRFFGVWVFVCHQGHGVSSGSALDVVLNDELQSFAVRISPLTGVQQKCSSVIVRLWFGVCFLC